MSDRFNNLPASTDSLVNPFRYTARESDTETDLYYYRARYYNSTLQRFISEDPVGLRGDRKSTRLNSSHTVISYAVFCLKKKRFRPQDPQNPLSNQARGCNYMQ